MEGIENILKCGQSHFINDKGDNIFALEFEICGGIDSLEELQLHKNPQVYELVFMILETYYNIEMGDSSNLMELITTSAESGVNPNF